MHPRQLDKCGLQMMQQPGGAAFADSGLVATASENWTQFGIPCKWLKIMTHCEEEHIEQAAAL